MLSNAGSWSTTGRRKSLRAVPAPARNTSGGAPRKCAAAASTESTSSWISLATCSLPLAEASERARTASAARAWASASRSRFSRPRMPEKSAM